MQIIKVKIFFTILACIVYTALAIYNTEKISIENSWIPYHQTFHSTKVETLYQCMELCSQFSMCKSLWEGSGTCKLFKVINREAVFIFPTSGHYYEASLIPKSISGVCANHTCSNDHRCIHYHSGNYKCVPHRLPSFTCEKGWLYFTRKCYHIYMNFRSQMSWKEAQTYCAERKSNLTEIESAEEQSFLHPFFVFTTINYFVPNATTFYWTSLKYVLNKAAWIWNASGRIQHDSSFSYWYPNYQELIRPDQDNCMMVSKNESYRWTVGSCSEKGVFVCERLMV